MVVWPQRGARTTFGFSWNENIEISIVDRPPGGDASGYAIVIGAFLAVSVLTTKTLLWMG